MEIKRFTPSQPAGEEQVEQIASFLHEHLEEYGDAKEDIRKALDYALDGEASRGGFILTGEKQSRIVGAVVVNHTGMEGYIPENILVYIAVHGGKRGEGIGKKLMQEAISISDGDIALHVEPDNPARRLYQKLGFTNKYLEMRLAKE